MLPKNLMWAKAKPAIDAMSVDSTTVPNAMTSELPSDRMKVGPKMIPVKRTGSQLAGRPNGLTRNSPTSLKPPSAVV